MLTNKMHCPKCYPHQAGSSLPTAGPPAAPSNHTILQSATLSQNHPQVCLVSGPQPEKGTLGAMPTFPQVHLQPLAAHGQSMAMLAHICTWDSCFLQGLAQHRHFSLLLEAPEPGVLGLSFKMHHQSPIWFITTHGFLWHCPRCTPPTDSKFPDAMAFSLQTRRLPQS